MKKVQNRYRVPVKQWRKWSELARLSFNRSYSFIHDNQSIIIHPKAKTAKPAEWKTIAWNAAWIAADATDDTIPDEVIEVHRSKPTGRKFPVKKVA